MKLKYVKRTEVEPLPQRLRHQLSGHSNHRNRTIGFYEYSLHMQCLKSQVIIQFNCTMFVHGHYSNNNCVAEMLCNVGTLYKEVRVRLQPNEHDSKKHIAKITLGWY